MNSFDYKTFINDLWPEQRDIVSDGYDNSINYIKNILPEMEIEEYKTGSEAWTWILPEKWSVKEAYIKDKEKVLVDLRDSPLHVMSYSIPFSGRVDKEELLAHIYSKTDQPDVIPFEFSYYEKRWGFCVEHNKLSEFTADSYEVLIDSKFEESTLKVGVVYVPGKTEKEIVLMAHLCHPCMVNDGLSGVAVLVSMIRDCINRADDNHYSYRFLILPETIGSIAYLSNNDTLIKNMEFGIFLDMVGHDSSLSLQRSRQGSSLIDRAAEIYLKDSGLDYRIGDYLEVVVNDEKVLNGPGIDVPSISISRSNFWRRGEHPFPQYHTSSDTPDIISVDRLKEIEAVVKGILYILDRNYSPKALVKGPVFLSRYGLWIDWRVDRALNLKQEEVFFYLHDESKSIIDIAYELDISFKLLSEWLEKFFENALIEKVYEV